MMKSRGFSLIEAVAVMAIITIAWSAGFMVLHRSYAGMFRTAYRAGDAQAIVLLARVWQDALRDTAVSSWLVSSNEFQSAEQQIRFDGRYISFHQEARNQTLPLPPTSKCRFAIEKSINQRDIAVLYVEWTERYMKRQRVRKVRYVACGRS